MARANAANRRAGGAEAMADEAEEGERGGEEMEGVADDNLTRQSAHESGPAAPVCFLIYH